MRNRPEYGELMAACFKGRLIHVNINYRYVAEEVFYIFDDSDSEVIVYSSEFRDCIVELKDRLEKVHTFVEIGEASQIAPFAIPYETQIGRAHVCTPVTHAHHVCPLLTDKK